MAQPLPSLSAPVPTLNVAPDLADVTAPAIDLTKPKATARSVPLPDATDSSCNPIQLVDITQAAGLDFEHYNGFSGEYYYVETFGSGAAFLDVDGDGWLDLYLVNGAPLSGERPDPIPTNRLYHNTGARGFHRCDGCLGSRAHRIRHGLCGC